MASQDEITHQRELLDIYRRNLAHEIRRASHYGGETLAPPEVANSINETRKNISSIKQWLRQRGVAVEDQTNDELSAPESAVNASTKESTSYHFNSPLNTGQAYVGGQHTIGETNVTMGDSISFSGVNISGSIINIKSKLDHVSQSVGALPQADEATKQALEQLIAQLGPELEKATQAGHAKDAEKVSSRAGALVEEASKPEPDKEIIEFNAESLKKAAGNIATVMPTVLAIATQIVEHIHKLVP